MTGPVTRLPERLRSAGGTDLEQRLLQSASDEQPSRELSERMAAGIGISAPVLLVAPKSAAAASKAALGARALVPWISGALVVIAAGGAVVGLHHRNNPALSAKSSPAPSAGSAAAPSAAPPVTVPLVAPEEPAPSLSPPRPSPRGSASASTTAADLRAQITLIDAARAAVSTGAGQRALEILRQYESKYGAGSFRPEARALKIEALAAAGRNGEARALAEQFVTQYRGSALADRVARIAGLTQSD